MDTVPQPQRPAPRRRHANRAAALLLAGAASLLAAPAGVAQQRLPEMGDASSAALPDRDAERLGAALMEHLRQRGRLVEDPLLVDYVRGLGRQLAGYSDRPAERFTFFVVNDPAINAFAAPGGYIGLHTGLIAAASGEDELAAVVAHEIAHVTQRHMARAYQKAGELQLQSAVMVLAALLLGQVDGQLGEAALAGTLAGTAQQEIDFTRGGEKEADSIGIALLARAGFDPAAMAGFFARLQRDERLLSNVLPEYLRTHPVTLSRITDATARAERMAPAPGRGEGIGFDVAQARVAVLGATDPQQAVDAWRGHLDAGRPGAGYGLALALQVRGRTGEALAALEAPLATAPDRPEYLLLKAELLAADGRPEEAARLFDSAVAIYPAHRALGLADAAQRLAAGDAASALARLQELQRRIPPEPRLFALLAEASARLGHRSDTHRYQAERLLLENRPAEAIEQLRLALAASDDGAYQGERLAARLAEVERQLREVRR